MDKLRCLTVLFSALLAGGAGAAEPPAGPGADAAQLVLAPQQPFAWAWTLVLPQRELGGGDWRSWSSPDRGSRRQGRSRRWIPGATVLVTDRFLTEHTERVLELNANWAPVLMRSFRLGWENSYTSEMLSEFMTMTSADLRPPSVPSVWYNGLVPYWVQQGWKAPTGGRLVVVSAPSDRPMIPYPGRR